MSIKLESEDPDVPKKFAFSVSGKRIIVRIDSGFFDDEFSDKNERDLIEALNSSVKANQSSILAEYDERNSAASNPQYVLTRQGLIHYAH